MKKISFIMTMLFVSFIGLNSFAQNATPAPTVPAVISVIQGQVSAGSIDNNTFMADVLLSVQSVGGLAVAMKIALAIMLLIGTMKVTSLDDMFWGKLGKFQAFAAPILGLILGILVLGYQGHITVPALFAYIGAGGGAILFHELLDAVKGIPGLGTVYVGIITFIEGALGGNPTGATPSTSAVKGS